jgi:hypothetical protein
MVNKKVEDILKKYGGRISQEIDSDLKVGDMSKEYVQFKQDMLPELTKFEKRAKSFGNILKLSLSEKDYKKMKYDLDSAHLDVAPGEVASYAFMAGFLVFFVSFLLFMGVFISQGIVRVDSFFNYLIGPAGLFLVLSFIASGFVFYYIYSSPVRLAKLWRLRAGTQMVPCILYLVVYMKHTSNLERAIAFASQHLEPPLSLDLKKIFWDVEVGKFSTIKESLDAYLESWKDENVEFVESFHLIESSLFEPSNSRRIQTLEKALEVILDGVYENTLKFSRNIRSPLTNVYMLGIVLPTLGLALLPLVSTLLGDLFQWFHVFILFNLIIPFLVFYITNQILLQRPGGYGEEKVLELNPDYHKYNSKKPYWIAGLICVPIIILGLLPLLFQSAFFVETLNLQPDYNFGTLGIDALRDVWFFDFKDVATGNTIKTLDELKFADKIVGPFGLGALILSLFVPLGIALFFSISFSMRTKDLLKARKDTKQLENEFTNSLFQLGNRIGDGLPAEIAFSRVAESTSGLKTAKFFKIVNLNMHQGGMSLENAIFDKRRGAIIYFPSQLISTSMRILLESVKKGLRIAADSLMSISHYLKNIRKVSQRLHDLLAEVIGDMKSNMVFLAPLLAGIVIGLASMITSILNTLANLFSQIGEGGSVAGFADMGSLLSIFEIVKMIPPYYLQLAIGVYIIQIVFILTNVLVTVDSGDDRLKKTSDVGKNLGRSIGLYFVVTLISILVLSALASVALAGIS